MSPYIVQYSFCLPSKHQYYCIRSHDHFIYYWPYFLGCPLKLYMISIYSYFVSGKYLNLEIEHVKWDSSFCLKVFFYLVNMINCMSLVTRGGLFASPSYHWVTQICSFFSQTPVPAGSSLNFEKHITN